MDLSDISPLLKITDNRLNRKAIGLLSQFMDRINTVGQIQASPVYTQDGRQVPMSLMMANWGPRGALPFKRLTNIDLGRKAAVRARLEPFSERAATAPRRVNVRDMGVRKYEVGVALGGGAAAVGAGFADRYNEAHRYPRRRSDLGKPRGG